MNIEKIKGFADIFPPESSAYAYMESRARRVFSRYGFMELRTPHLEFARLFQRSIGDDTDVVQKEMYVFPDSKGRAMALRPEATAGVMRAFIDSGLAARQQICRFFTIGAMFRHERPQKGRMRQFHQINCECLGTQSPLADAELVCMLMQFLSSIGIDSLSIELNTLGCAQCRPRFREALLEYLRALDAAALCDDCVRRIKTNPLRILDCKKSTCRELTENAPRVFDYACPECRTHFDAVLELIAGENISHSLNYRLVRGLDYYCRTTFEVISTDIGAQAAVAGGGRYDGLVKNLGGPDVPGVGFACGMERLALLMPKLPSAPLDFYLLVMDPAYREQAFRLVQELRGADLAGEMNFVSSGFKSLMRQADKSGARFCLIYGPEEAAQQLLTVKDMVGGIQTKIAFDSLINYLKTGSSHD